MAVYNLGSINIDHFYSVPHLPKPGETLAATAYSTGLGGKGANQSIAAVQGGARVLHIGAVGDDGAWAVSQLEAANVSIENIAVMDVPTGHAVINVDPDGENAIVISCSANTSITQEGIRNSFEGAGSDDICILQNETNLVSFAAELAQNRGMRVVYSAAPFDLEHVQETLPFVNLLVLNEVEAQQLSDVLGVTAAHFPVPEVLVTKGRTGSVYRSGDQEISVEAFAVDTIDTTGAGDTYLGFFVAGLDTGMDVKGAMTFAAAGSAIQVTRKGTSDAIPNLEEVKVFLEENLKT